MNREPDVAVPASGRRSLRSRISWQAIWRLIRYSLTSVVALAVSEVALLIIVGMHLAGATTAAAIASLAGVVPSYLLSRYWIWPGADRTRTAAQVTQYWVVSLVSIAITSFGTGFIAHHVPAQGAEHVAVIGLGFPAMNLLLFVAKFFVYQKVIFRHGSPVAGDAAVLAAETIPARADLPRESLLPEA